MSWPGLHPRLTFASLRADPKNLRLTRPLSMYVSPGPLIVDSPTNNQRIVSHMNK